MDDSLTQIVNSFSGNPPSDSIPPTQAQVNPNEQVSAPSDPLTQAVLSGQKQLKGNVNLVDSSGESWNIPADQVREALKQGYRLETSKETAVREIVQQNKGLKGDVKQALKSFTNQALFEIPEVIEKATQDPFEIEKSRAIAKDHNFASAIGGVLGFGTSLMVGAPVFKAATEAGQVAEKVVANKLKNLGIEKGSESLAKSIVAKTAQNAAKYGVEGAVIATPKAITESVLGDPEAGAESLLMSGGVGMGLGLVAGPAGKVLEKILPKGLEGTAEALETLRNQRLAKAVGFTKGQIKKVGGQEAAEDVAEHLFNARLSNGEKVIGPLSTTDDIYNNVKQLQSESGQRIGNIYKQLDEMVPGSVNVSKLENFIKSEVGTKYKGKLRQQEANVLNTILEDLSTIKGERSSINVGEAKSFLDDIAGVAFPKGKMPLDPTPRQSVAYDVWTKLRGQIDEAAEKAAETSGEENILQNLRDARKDFSMSNKARKSLEDKISSEQGNKLFGLTDTILGAEAGSHVGAIPGMLSVLAKKSLEKYGNVISAELLDKSIDGILAVSKFMNKAGDKLNEVPGVLSSLQQAREALTPSVSKGASAINRLIGDDSIPKDKALDKLKSKVIEWVSNPSAFSDHISQQTNILKDTGAPNVADAFSNKMIQSVNYIYNNMPKSMAAPNPLMETEYKPSDLEMAAFDRKLSVLENPFIVLDALKDGTLTKDHMTSLAANYPILAKAIRGRIFNHISEQKQKYNYQSRLKLSLMLGINADNSLNAQNIAGFQNAFAFLPQVSENNLNHAGVMKMNPAEQAMTKAQKGLLT